ncbi:hypothetical protein BJ165DRAFT_1526974 [Panaeolus papilionaceus]|nr:hypothetical protein BJ165DRAFT_1526974 [Panaeolus papilionaceus]
MDATVTTVAMMHATAISGYATTQNRKLLMFNYAENEDDNSEDEDVEMEGGLDVEHGDDEDMENREDEGGEGEGDEGEGDESEDDEGGDEQSEDEDDEEVTIAIKRKALSALKDARCKKKFKVEDTIFRAFKKAFLYPGCFFITLFALPQPSNDSVDSQLAEGSSEAHPITLEGISKREFLSFLKVLTPIEGVPRCSTYNEWMGVLNLATMWDFPTASQANIRHKAISALTPHIKMHSAPDRILISWKYEVKAWLIDAFVQAACEPISRKKLRHAGIDPDTISGLYAVRDTAFVKSPDDDVHKILVNRGQCRAAHVYVYQIGNRAIQNLEDWNTYYPAVTKIDLGRMRDIVCEEFADELRKMRND